MCGSLRVAREDSHISILIFASLWLGFSVFPEIDGWHFCNTVYTKEYSNQSFLKEINPEYLLHGLRLKLKLQYFGHLMQRLIGKDPDAG